MAQGDFLLTMTGVRGESGDKEFPDSIEVTGWSFSGSSTWDINSGQKTSRVRLSELTVTKRVDLSTPVLMRLMCDNRVIDDVKLINRKAGGQRQEDFFRIELKNARVRSVVQKATSIGGSILEETVSFIWQKVKLIHREQSQRGSLQGGGVEFEYDWEINT